MCVYIRFLGLGHAEVSATVDERIKIFIIFTLRETHESEKKREDEETQQNALISHFLLLLLFTFN